MYGKGSGAEVYQKTHILTAEPMKLVILCYDNAVGQLRAAKEHYQSGRYEAKAKCLQKTLGILQELSSALDMEKGGPVAINLRSLYTYMMGRLLEGDLKRNLKAFDEVIGMLDELGSAWKEIFYGSKKEAKNMPDAIPGYREPKATASAGWRG
jgi:flagellar secretion chaperone FliS